MITVITAALLCGILAGLGVGSGGIFVVCLTLLLGTDQLLAQSLNLIFFVASSVAALVINIIKKRIALGIVLWVSLPGCVGAIGGAIIAHDLGSSALSKLFGGMLITCGLISLVGTLKNKKD